MPRFRVMPVNLNDPCWQGYDNIVNLKHRRLEPRHCGVLLLFKFGLPSKIRAPVRVIEHDKGKYEKVFTRY